MELGRVQCQLSSRTPDARLDVRWTMDMVALPKESLVTLLLPSPLLSEVPGKGIWSKCPSLARDVIKTSVKPPRYGNDTP